MLSIGQCIHDVAMSHGLLISLFLAGLVGGFTHCAGMCSPFVLAQVGNDVQFRKIKSFLLLPYHLGRMTTYVALAVVINSLVNLAFVFSGLKALISAPLLLLAGIVFFVSAFPRLSSIFPWVARIQIGAPYRFLSRFSSALIGNPNAIKRYGLGVLLGFMPCGLVLSALLASASAPSAVAAAVAMGGFALGTIPALVVVAVGGGALKAKYPKIFSRLSQGAMVVSSLWLFALAGSMVF